MNQVQERRQQVQRDVRHLLRGGAAGQQRGRRAASEGRDGGRREPRLPRDFSLTRRPIMKDKIWFFGAARVRRGARLNCTLPSAISARQASGAQPPSRSRRRRGPSNRFLGVYDRAIYRSTEVSQFVSLDAAFNECSRDLYQFSLRPHHQLQLAAAGRRVARQPAAHPATTDGQAEHAHGVDYHAGALRSRQPDPSSRRHPDLQRQRHLLPEQVAGRLATSGRGSSTAAGSCAARNGDRAPG